MDAQGRVHPEAENVLTVQVEGAGRLIGVDNGNMAEMTLDFRAHDIKAFHGLCLAVVQSTAISGEIRLTASSPGLKSVTVSLTAEA